MALRSMTGFGQAVVEGAEVRVKVEIRSVNHRFAEFQWKMSRDLFALEEEVRGLAAKRIGRGRVDGFVSVEPVRPLPVRVSVNWALLDALCEAERAALARQGAADTGLRSLAHWMTYPGVVTVETGAYDPDALRQAVLSAVDQALDRLVDMRSREGRRIEGDLLAKLDDLAHLVREMERRSPEAAEAALTRLRQRVQAVAPGVDEQRILSEAAVLADRACIDEELVRLESHIAEFRKSVGEGSPVGRRLDFIVQEMHREVNTIGSKTTDLCISKAVLEAKALVEQLREQAQNIE
ncbi:YicC/YloC family endoribonuclease [Alicyclobacillus sp.]|uniref:YicC/YloC family endoribonuclease n=1 Tax=Alicyclobacillus sp. TaxID=61169 RepID=UPI0025C2BF8B|nr:YicC/YloC family endoribonuclease [Alicyclobacillus sp.]MCL6515412.1 YicC family protein [Alicyclobacillus sp.]